MNAYIIPIQIETSAGATNKLKITADEIQECPLADLTAKGGGGDVKIREEDLEEFVRTKPEVILGSEETLLIVGQQVRSKTNKRSDLVAVDMSGNIVIIELKRGAKDAAARVEPLEFQAIRYAANCSLLSKAEVKRDLFVPYLKKHWAEFAAKEPQVEQLAHEKLEKFLQDNGVGVFNQKQRIVLVAPSFEGETLSACAWLSKNGIDLSCVTVSPFKYNDQVFLAVEQILPPPRLEEFNVGVAKHSEDEIKSSRGKGVAVKESLPRMPVLFEWEIVKPGYNLYIKGHPAEKAEVVDAKTVKFNGQVLGYNDWGKKVTGWSVINIYEWACLEKSNKSLDQLRSEKMQELAMQNPPSDKTD